MNILAIETTGAKASVAIINSDNDIFEENSSESLNHLQNLMPMVGKILEKSKLQINDVTAVAASEGPGSFTGIRIGVSSARALGQALEIKCISVPTLPSFIYNLPKYKGIVCPIFNARRNQVYGGAYIRYNDNEYKEIVQGGAYMLDEYLSMLRTAIKEDCPVVTFFGDGVEAYRPQIEEWQNLSLNNDLVIDFAEEEVRYQKASSVAQFAIELFKKGETCEYTKLEPNYMRKAEAERKLEEAQAKEKR